MTLSYLLDTNILSELVKPQPNSGVVQWVLEHPEPLCFISVVTLSELQFGIERMPVSTRQVQIKSWLNHDLKARFAGRIISIDERIAMQCGTFRAIRQNLGVPLAIADGLIAASAMMHDLVVVTRNTKDFEHLDIQLMNPFQ